MGSNRLRNLFFSDGKARKKTIALVLAAIMVAGAFTILYVVHQNDKNLPPSVYFPIKFTNGNASASTSISYVNGYPYIGGAGGYNLSNVTVKVCSDVPSSLYNNPGYSSHTIEKNKSSNNSYYVDLYNGRAGSNGAATGRLNSSFETILSQYRSMYAQLGSNPQIQVSMEIYANYQYTQDGMLYIYHYFNELPFNLFNPFSSQFTQNLLNPLKPQYTFNQEITFDMNQAPTVLHVNASKNNTSTPLRTIGGGGGGGSGPISCPDQVTTKITTFYGPLPYYIGMVNQTSSVNYEQAMGISYTNMELTLGASSVTSYSNSSSI